MILTEAELLSLVQLQHPTPHQLLGLHPLGDGSGVVARAMIPDAAKVELAPTHEKNKPAFTLKLVHPAGVFEGLSTLATQVYAYDLIITDRQGRTRQTRDPYSFLPTLGESDLYLFNQGNEQRVYTKLGAQLKTVDGVPGTAFALWAPNARRVSVVGDFNQWDGRFHPMRLLGLSALQIRNPEHARRRHAADRSLRLFLRDRAQERQHCLGQSAVPMDRPGMDEATGRVESVQVARQHLRSPPRFLAKEECGGVAELPRAGGAAG
jgi:1,4-alpha-glucan branching enzyme